MMKVKKYLIGLTILVVSMVDTGWAAALDYQFYSANDIRYYVPESDLSFYGQCGSSSFSLNGISVVVSGNTAEEKLWIGLMNGGFTAEQAAGIMGNLYGESGLSPTRHEATFYGRDIWDGNIAFGIGLAQWSFGRRIELLTILKERGLLDPYITDYETYGKMGGQALVESGVIASDVLDALYAVEIQYLIDEMQNNEHAAYEHLVANSGTPEDAAYSVYLKFERSAQANAHPEIRPAERERFAREIYDKMKGINGDSVIDAVCGDTSGIAMTTLSYAWPDYRGGDTTRKPEYAEAVARALGDNPQRYVGGCEGVDCGGFVTTLVHDSGLDTNYNSYESGTRCGTGCQNTYLDDPQNGWEALNPEDKSMDHNAEGNNPIDTSILQPGDVAIRDGHTFIFVGDIPGFDSNIASASLCDRAPMAGREDLVRGGSNSVASQNIRWYRKVGV